MELAAQNNLHRSVTDLIVLHVIAFAVFHLNSAIMFSLTYQIWLQGKEWPTVVVWLVYLMALYGPVAMMIAWTIRRRANVILVAAVSTGTLWCAYNWQYPLMTSFLVSLDQMDRYAVWWFERLPVVPLEYRR